MSWETTLPHEEFMVRIWAMLDINAELERQREASRANAAIGGRAMNAMRKARKLGAYDRRANA